MPLPTASDVHVNRPLTNISIAYVQDQKNFIATQVFPVIPVAKQSDAYFLYDNAYWNRDEMQLRVSGSESAGNGYAIDGTNTYFANRYSFHKDIPDDVRANADAPINLDTEATLYTTQKALIKREKMFAASFLTTGIWNTDITGGVTVLKWNDANSTPIEDVWDQKQVILKNTGFEPNVLVLGYPVYKTLVNHVDFVDRVKYGATPGGPAMIDLTEMAALFKVGKVVVMRAIENTAKEGAAAATNDFIGNSGKCALLCYAPPNPGLMTPSAGYTFSWTGLVGAGAEGLRIKRYRMEHLDSDRVEIDIAYAMKLTSATLGSYFTSIVA